MRGIEITRDFFDATEWATLSRGLGRSYGDASLPADSESPVASSLSANRLLSFHETTGVVRAEAGVTLRDLNRNFLPRGWCTPVSPGTQFVTLGGMVAADVHGKNHHVRGSFGEHVRCLRMRVADGSVLECSDGLEPELFRATLGGMGLTGHILEVEFTMEAIPSPWILSESARHTCLDDVIRALLEGSRTWPFTVAWVDCLKRGPQMGRGIVMCGRWADGADVPQKTMRPRRGMAVPFLLPGGVLGTRGVRTFNRLYFRKHGRRVRRGAVHPEAFFYPLDAIRNWNHLYGRRGFTQYQCVLADERSCQRLFEILTAREGDCFLCVMKDFGEEGKGMISFPRRGISIALDIPLRGRETQELVDTLNRLVADEGGRIYLAKDALTRPEHYRDLETRLDGWNAVRRRWDPQGRLRSALSCRLLGDRGGAAT
ncbi:MAG: FAD-binding protein [Planctomycetota bacterium]